MRSLAVGSEIFTKVRQRKLNIKFVFNNEFSLGFAEWLVFGRIDADLLGSVREERNNRYII